MAWCLDAAVTAGGWASPAERLPYVVDFAQDADGPAGMAAETAAERIRLLRNVHALQRYVAHWLAALDSDRMDTHSLATPANELAQRLTEAIEVLCEVESGYPLDESVFPDSGAPGPADLLRARARGDVRAAADVFDRRLALLEDGDHSGEPARWSVTVRPDRCYEALANDGTRIYAWSALPAAFETELATWSQIPGPIRADYRSERPELLPERMEPNDAEMEKAPTSPHGFAPDVDDNAYALGGHADRLAYILGALRTTLGPDQVQDFVDKRVAHLNTCAPQLPALDPAPNRSVFDHTNSAAFTWVDPATIVHTPDFQAWGTIDRETERSGAVWIPEAIREWLIEDDVPLKLRYAMTAGHVQLHRFAGPVGPLHTMTVNGSHRTHLWRILNLPAIFAFVENTPLPIQLTPFDVSTEDGTPDEADETAAVWKGLLAKGILHGRLDRPHSPYPTLEIHAVPAQWLLYPPRLAAAYGRRYAELYGAHAWTRASIPSEAFASPSRWLAWATAS